MFNFSNAKLKIKMISGNKLLKIETRLNHARVFGNYFSVILKYVVFLLLGNHMLSYIFFFLHGTKI